MIFLQHLMEANREKLLAELGSLVRIAVDRATR